MDGAGSFLKPGKNFLGVPNFFNLPPPEVNYQIRVQFSAYQIFFPFKIILGVMVLYDKI